MCRLLLLAALAHLACCAPVLETDEQPLLRVKRSAERIMYGNMQNKERVKKAGPIPALEGVQSDDLLDKHSTVKTEAMPAEDVVIPPQGMAAADGESTSKTDDIEKTLDKLVNGNEEAPAADETDETVQPQNLTPNEEIPQADVQAVPAQMASDMVEDMSKEPIHDDLTEDEAETSLEQLGQEKTEDSELLNALMGQEQEAKEQEELGDFDWSDIPEEYLKEYLKEYYDPSYGSEDESVTSQRQERSVADAAVKAEDMASMNAPLVESQKNNRIKRDLADDDEGVFGGYPVSENSVNYPLSEAEELEMEREYMRSMVDNEINPYGELQAYPQDPYEFEEALRQEEIEEEAVEEEAAEERLAVLQYLQEREEIEEQQEEALRQAEEEAEEAEVLSYLSQEQEREYEPIVYNGQPGVFVPAKRQYLSMVPGVRKRASDFYPYGYEPDSRWGAMVAQEKEKRNQEAMYERLFRLAEALRGEEGVDDEQPYWQKK